MDRPRSDLRCQHLATTRPDRRQRAARSCSPADNGPTPLENIVKTVLTLLAVALFLSTGSAWARKPCEELRQEIATGLDAKGVRNYQLTVIAKDTVDTRKTVGTCNGGTERIVYERATPVADTAVAKR
jgi:hypothetical protein